jgi:hypothetical protein
LGIIISGGDAQVSDCVVQTHKDREHGRLDSLLLMMRGMFGLGMMVRSEEMNCQWSSMILSAY